MLLIGDKVEAVTVNLDKFLRKEVSSRNAGIWSISRGSRRTGPWRGEACPVSLVLIDGTYCTKTRVTSTRSYSYSLSALSVIMRGLLLRGFEALFR